ncbi:putative Zinc finger, CCHC-type, Piwi domain, ribonuclease H-like superfamily [Septoria linicola]|nr:putative Zinc finger, CCHC-type, Piwi domain, ribonuclease H-like superfamily [Septoria linicola]
MSGKGNNLPSHGGPPTCANCHLTGHNADNCTACKTCYRTGHRPQDCPYIAANAGGKNHCSHCDQTGHLVGKCEARPGCAADDCDSKQHARFHDHKGGLPATVRAVIRGPAAVPRAPNVAPPKVATRYANGNAPAQAPPNCITGTLKYLADTSQLGNNNSVSVITNYVSVPNTPPKVYEYRIDIVPAPPTGAGVAAREMTQRSERKRVFNALQQLPPLVGHNDYFTDYDTLWSCTELNANQCTQTNVQYTKQSGRTAQVHSTTFAYLRTLRFDNGTTDLVGRAILDGPVNQQRNPNLLIKALNGMVTKCITERQQNDLFEATANSFYLRNGATMLQNSLLIHRGYFSSVRPGETSVLLNVNIMHGTFIRPTLVTTFLNDMNLPGRNYGDPQALLKGRTVRLTYARGNNNGVNQDAEAHRKKQIAGFGLIPQLQQFDDGVRMWTVKEWYETQGLPIHFPMHPCVNVGLAAGGRPGGTGALWIPAEYLEIEPCQPFGKMLNSTHMRDMLTTALKHPAANQAAINLRLQPQLLQIPAQFLNAPRLEYRSTIKERILRASWDIASDKFFRVTTALQDSLPLGALDFRTRPGPAATDIGSGLLARCHDHGLLSRAPKADDVKVINGAAYLPRFPLNNGTWKIFCESVGPAWMNAGKPAFVLVLIDQQDVELYAAIKLLADRRGGFKTVVLTNGKLPQQNFKLREGNQLAGLFSNLALKFNIKSGGQNHAIQSAPGQHAFDALNSGGGPPNAAVTANTGPLKSSAPKPLTMPGGGPKKLTMPGAGSRLPAKGATRTSGATTTKVKVPLHTDTMVIGVDVVHPGGDTPSIAAMVGSVDSHFANFPGSIQLQPGRVEVLEPANMQALFEERLAAFQKKNAAPKRILYYRDGVSEDQYYQVIDKEVKAIQKVLPKVAITVIVVGKRHHTRFFCANDKDSYPDPKKGHPTLSGAPDINGNARPGLLVDKIITMPVTQDGFCDFFLQSHAALAGTAKSAHYVVIRNDQACNLNMAAIHNITHAFCYDYARATKGVSYCAPAYYADRLCDRAHKFLKLHMEVFRVGPKYNSMNLAEKQMRDRKAAGLRYRLRLALELSNDPHWLLPGRTNPWHANMDDIMWWL